MGCNVLSSVVLILLLEFTGSIERRGERGESEERAWVLKAKLDS